MPEAYGFDQTGVRRIVRSVRKSEGTVGPPTNRRGTDAAENSRPFWVLLTSEGIDDEAGCYKWHVADWDDRELIDADTDTSGGLYSAIEANKTPGLAGKFALLRFQGYDDTEAANPRYIFTGNLRGAWVKLTGVHTGVYGRYQATAMKGRLADQGTAGALTLPGALTEDFDVIVLSGEEQGLETNWLQAVENEQIVWCDFINGQSIDGDPAMVVSGPPVYNQFEPGDLTVADHNSLAASEDHWDRNKKTDGHRLGGPIMVSGLSDVRVDGGNNTLIRYERTLKIDAGGNAFEILADAKSTIGNLGITLGNFSIVGNGTFRLNYTKADGTPAHIDHEMNELTIYDVRINGMDIQKRSRSIHFIGVADDWGAWTNIADGTDCGGG